MAADIIRLSSNSNTHLKICVIRITPSYWKVLRGTPFSKNLLSLVYVVICLVKATNWRA